MRRTVHGWEIKAQRADHRSWLPRVRRMSRLPGWGDDFKFVRGFDFGWFRLYLTARKPL